MRLSSYMRHQYQFSYLRTINDVEVDLIIERPGKSTLYIEIKSTDEVTHDTLTFFKKITRDEKNVEALCLSNDPNQPSERELLVGVAIFSEST